MHHGNRSHDDPNSPGGKTGIRRPTRSHVRARYARLDVALILIAGLLAECAHFGWRDGRPILNGDSLQYVDAAAALSTPDLDPSFALRKPGYPLLLAGVARLTGDMSWSALALNHFLLGLLPAVAYAIGRALLSRSAGWLAAMLMIARLQAFVLGDRIMSEAPYILLLTIAFALLINAFRDPRTRRWFVAAGICLALAWLIRAIAITAILAGLICCVWLLRRQPRRLVGACLCLTLPVAAAALFECSLNLAYAGRFQTSTGSLGMMLLMRTRHLQGLPMPQTEAGQRCLALLPERHPDDAYRASELDAWVARYRAIHDEGMDEWQTDKIMRQAALEIATAQPLEFLRCSEELFTRHLLRRNDIRLDRNVAMSDRRPCIVHPAALDDPDFDTHWYAYWGLPHRSLDESLALAGRVRQAADRRAPFSWTEPLPTLRFASMTPTVTDISGALGSLAALWPGLAIMAFLIAGPNRSACALLGLAYVFEAVLISLCCPSEIAAARYQSAWIGTDTALTAALLVLPVHLCWSRMKTGVWYRFAPEFTAPVAPPI